MVESDTRFFRNAKPARENFMRALQRKWAMKIGRIEQLLISPCSANTPGGPPVDIIIWITAFFAGIPEAVVTLNRHDCSDNLWDKNKNLWAPLPKGRGGRHGRRGTPSNPSEGRAPGITQPARGWQQWAFNFGNFMEKVGAKLMIIDAALDLGVNWQSNYLNWNGCGAPPPCFTTATVARDVVGWDGGDLRNDLIGHPGSVGIICGIGGFATTVPVGQLEMAGSVGDRPFLFVPYAPISGTYWVVDAVGGGDPPALDQSKTISGTDNQAGTVHGSRASMHTLASTNRTGSINIARSHVTDTACQIDPANIVTIMGETEGLLTSDPTNDPCSNMPITGTAPSVRK